MFGILQRHEGFIRRFARYLMVGGLGFLLDFGGMELLVALGVSPYPARAVSMALAIALTFTLHRRVTFAAGATVKGVPRQFGGFVFCQGLSGLLNYAVFFCALRASGMTEVPLMRFAALAMGVGVGLVSNYFLLSRFVFLGAHDIWTFLRQKLIVERKWWIWGAIVPALFADAWDRQRDVLALGQLPRPLEPWDPDVWMRLYKVRAWLAGGDFYDRTVAMTNAPLGGVTTPWTRPLDFLLAFAARLMPQDFTLDQQLLLAATWLPFVLALVTLFFLSRAAQQVFDHVHVIACAILLMLVNAIFQNYLMPGSADHHGLLILLWCAVLGLLLQPPSVVAKLAAGVVLGVMLWVSPEALMLIAVVYAVLGARALWHERDIRDLAVLSAATAVTAALVLLFETPPAQYFSYVVYDSLSIVYVSLLSFTGLAVAALSFILPRLEGWVARGVASGVAALCAAAATLFFFPKFIHGPLAEADPYIFRHFLPNISEATPLLQAKAFEILIRLYVPLTAIYLLVKSHFTPRPFWRDRRLQFLAAFLALTLVMTAGQLRWNYYLQPVAIIIVAIYLPLFSLGAKSEGFGWLKPVPRLLRPYAWLFLLACMTSAGAFYLKENRSQYAKFYGCQSQIRYLIESGQLEKAFGPSPVVFFAPANIGGDFAFFTPYRIIAGNYHREGQGMAAWSRIMAQENAAAARPLLQARKVGGLAVCAGQYSKSSWLSALDKKHPAWLQPVKGWSFMPVTAAPQDSDVPAAESADVAMPVIFKVK